MVKNELWAFIELLDTYKNGYEGLHIPYDDCGIISKKFKQICQKYNIPEFDEK